MRQTAKTAAARRNTPAKTKSAATFADRPLLATLRARGQVTLAPALRKAFDMQEGDPVLMEATAEGILLRPKKLIDASQAWFWSEQWQKGELEASEDIHQGRVKRHRSSKSFLNSLDD